MGIESLEQEKMGSPVHQLALVVAMRQFFMQKDEVGPIEACLRETRLLSILTRIFDIESVEEEFYFLKLEALWLLISLSMVDGDDIKMLLLSEFAIAQHKEKYLMTDFSPQASSDFFNEKSAVLERMNVLLKDSLNGQEGPDMKILSLVI